MIRKNTINCKLSHEKRTVKKIFNSCMDSFRLDQEVCPHCGCFGKLRIHAYYNRTLIDLVDGRPGKIRLCVRRLICDTCENPSTHAVLPDPIIPYCRHSLLFIIRVLAEHALRLRSIEKICEAFEISENTFYRWQKLFEDHSDKWKGLIESTKGDLLSFILELVRKDPYSGFARFFIQITGRSFLQAHRNPPNLQCMDVSSDTGCIP